MTPSKLFTAEQKHQIKLAVESAELDTSGEIRIHIENTCNGDVMERVAFVFDKLGMQKTELRNGVLIYLAIKNRKFAIIGDAGINKVVPTDFWERIKTNMLLNFREDKFTEGIAEAIKETGEQLKKHFPFQTNDVNELSDEISFEDN